MKQLVIGFVLGIAMTFGIVSANEYFVASDKQLADEIARGVAAGVRDALDDCRFRNAKSDLVYVDC